MRYDVLESQPYPGVWYVGYVESIDEEGISYEERYQADVDSGGHALCRATNARQNLLVD